MSWAYTSPTSNPRTQLHYHSYGRGDGSSDRCPGSLLFSSTLGLPIRALAPGACSLPYSPHFPPCRSPTHGLRSLRERNRSGLTTRASKRQHGPEMRACPLEPGVNPDSVIS